MKVVLIVNSTDGKEAISFEGKINASSEIDQLIVGDFDFRKEKIVYNMDEGEEYILLIAQQRILKDTLQCGKELVKKRLEKKGFVHRWG